MWLVVRMSCGSINSCEWQQRFPKFPDSRVWWVIWECVISVWLAEASHCVVEVGNANITKRVLHDMHSSAFCAFRDMLQFVEEV